MRDRIYVTQYEGLDFLAGLQVVAEDVFVYADPRTWFKARGSISTRSTQTLMLPLLVFSPTPIFPGCSPTTMTPESLKASMKAAGARLPMLPIRRTAHM